MEMYSEYINNIKDILAKIESSEEIICQVGELIGQCYMEGGMLHVFGTGHSHMLGLEMFYRAGGLVRVNPILDESLMLHKSAVKSTEFERIEGYAERLYNNSSIKKGDVIIIASNSGRNAVPVDMAEICRNNGVTVVAITNLNQSINSTSRAKSKLKLYEIADVVLDNYGVSGDACIKLEGSNSYIAPTSTASGAIIVNLILIATVNYLKSKGEDAEVFASSNVDGGDKINQEFIDKYRDTIKAL